MSEPTIIRPDARRIAGVLGSRGLADGRYYEEPDGMEWLAREANDVADAMAEGRDPAEVLIDTGFWTPEDEGPFPEDLRRDLQRAFRC